MPTINIKFSRSNVVDLHNMALHIKGSAERKAAIDEFLKLLTLAWPECLTGEATPNIEVREVQFPVKAQRALSEGMLALAQDEKGSLVDFSKIKELAKTCKLWNWISSHFPELPDFEGSLDEEPLLLDVD